MQKLSHIVQYNRPSANYSLLHEFQWKQGGSIVLLTGSFDGWRQSIKMTKDPSTGYFSATVRLDPTQKWLFKFVVDGVWRCSLEFPTETDPMYNVNNVLYPAPDSLASRSLTSSYMKASSKLMPLDSFARYSIAKELPDSLQAQSSSAKMISPQ